MPIKRIRVVVVDDSIMMREAISAGLQQDAGLEVVGKASDPYEARDMIVELEPDVLTLDVEMPRMNGIDFLKLLMPQYPMPVVVVSSLSNIVFEAMNSGAVDFVAKPGARPTRDLNAFIQELVVKIKIASMAKVAHMKRSAPAERITGDKGRGCGRTLIAIGASTGGTEATLQVLKSFPPDMPGTVIVQHMPPVFTRMYAERLNANCLMQVREAQDGDIVSQGQAFVAPGDKHMQVVLDKGVYRLRCREGDKVSGHCPSVDVLFDSVADAAKKCAIGVILTGMGADGAKGLQKMRKAGAMTIGQDEKTCVVYGMPMAAYTIGAVARQAALEDIPAIIQEHLEKMD
jgi:two-component system, chemotaxis family, protein-glutamate methylesterase/glutaminase